MQDIKHCFKKIRNSILASRCSDKPVRILKWQGHLILWQHFEEAHAFNCKSDLRIFRKLTKEHVTLNTQAKMRNHLATDVLGKDMLNLMKGFQKSLRDPSVLNGTVALLEQTSVLVDIFLNTHSKIESEYDHRIEKVLKVLHFFHEWENEYVDVKLQRFHLITRETREDIDSSLYGFIEAVKLASKNQLCLNAGYFNSDLIENWFCMQRGQRHGCSQNPTIAQIGPANNTNLLTGCVISSKGNAAAGSLRCKAVEPRTKKFRAKQERKE